MNDVILTTGEDVNLTIKDGPTLKFYDVITITNTFDYAAYLASLDEYDSDESAILGGLSVGDIYRTSDDHATEAGGVAKQVRAI